MAYFFTILITLGWSLLSYSSWHPRGKLPEFSGLRFLVLILPSSYFLIIALSAWPQEIFLRLDVAALLLLDFITLLNALLLGIFFKHQKFPKIYKIILGVYHSCGIFLAIAVHLLRFSPTMLIQIAYFLRQFERVDLLSLNWLSLMPEAQDQQFEALLKKIILAVLSYVPIAIVRFLSALRQRLRLRKDIRVLEQRMGELEAKVSRHLKGSNSSNL